MSGGYFDCSDYNIEIIANDIEALVRENGAQEVEDRLSSKTIAEFEKAVKVLRLARIYAKRIDYLVAGDDGEETFHRRLKGDLEDNEYAKWVENLCLAAESALLALEGPNPAELMRSPAAHKQWAAERELAVKQLRAALKTS